jgi:hypothetical protein
MLDDLLETSAPSLARLGDIGLAEKVTHKLARSLARRRRDLE